MNNQFNTPARMTSEERAEALKKQADAIEKRLNTPQSPTMYPKPKGQLARDGQAYARKAANEQRIDINRELKDIQKQIDQRKALQGPNKAKTL